MMKNEISMAIVLLFTIIANYQIHAQVTKLFQPRFQSYVKGNIVSVANSIVNRRDGLNSTNDAYTEIGKSAKLNDEFEMNYIDIDNDPTTFSSSSSTLNLQSKQGVKIIYAGLYWSATYKFEKGKQKKNKMMKQFRNIV